MVRNATTTSNAPFSMATSGVSWNTAISFVEAGVPQGAIFYSFNTPSILSSTSHTFTWQPGGSYGMGMSLWEFSGLGGGILDTTVVASSGSSNQPLASTSLTAAKAGELILAMYFGSYTVATGVSNPAVNASFTQAPNVYSPQVISVVQTNELTLGNDEYLLSSASGANALSYGTATNMGLWGAWAVAFQVAAGLAASAPRGMPPFFMGGRH